MFEQVESLVGPEKKYVTTYEEKLFNIFCDLIQTQKIVVLIERSYEAQNTLKHKVIYCSLIQSLIQKYIDINWPLRLWDLTPLDYFMILKY